MSAVNLSGAFFLSQPALAHMLERGSGWIVNLSSVVGETGNIGQTNYAASKSGLFGMTKPLAHEAAAELARLGKRTDDGIGTTVNAVTPGLITTEMTAAIPEKVLASPDHPTDPRRRGGTTRGGRTGRALPGSRRLLHRRTGVERQRRHGDVIPTQPDRSTLVQPRWGEENRDDGRHL